MYTRVNLLQEQLKYWNDESDHLCQISTHCQKVIYKGTIYAQVLHSLEGKHRWYMYNSKNSKRQIKRYQQKHLPICSDLCKCFWSPGQYQISYAEHTTFIILTSYGEPCISIPTKHHHRSQSWSYRCWFTTYNTYISIKAYWTR